MLIESTVRLPADAMLPGLEGCVSVGFMKLKVICAKGMESVIGSESKTRWQHRAQKPEGKAWPQRCCVLISYALGDAVEMDRATALLIAMTSPEPLLLDLITFSSPFYFLLGAGITCIGA